MSDIYIPAEYQVLAWEIKFTSNFTLRNYAHVSPQPHRLAPASLRRRCLCPYLVLSRPRVFSSRFHLTKCNKKQTPLSILPPFQSRLSGLPHAHGELTRRAANARASLLLARDGYVVSAGDARLEGRRLAQRPGYPSSTRRCSRASCRT